MSAASREDTSGGRSVRRKSLDRPDETRRFPNGIGTLVDIGPLAIGRAILDGNADKAEILMREHMDIYVGRMGEMEPLFANSTISWG